MVTLTLSMDGKPIKTVHLDGGEVDITDDDSEWWKPLPRYEIETEPDISQVAKKCDTLEISGFKYEVLDVADGKVMAMPC